MALRLALAPFKLTVPPLPVKVAVSTPVNAVSRPAATCTLALVESVQLASVAKEPEPAVQFIRPEYTWPVVVMALGVPTVVAVPLERPATLLALLVRVKPTVLARVPADAVFTPTIRLL